jgi:riboflavin synthase
MFTGLIEGTGKVVKVESRGRDMRLSIEGSFDLHGLEVGESISVDGVCLTVVTWERRIFTVDVSQETLSRSTLEQRRVGDHVNLERALRFGDRLGGHLVSGHIDGTARLISRRRRGESIVLEFAVDTSVARYLIEKGSVAINGVSLTVNRCDKTTFDVNLVPHTAGVTTIGTLKEGNQVNIEVDMIGKYVEKFVHDIRDSVSSASDQVNHDFLAKHGFI